MLTPGHLSASFLISQIPRLYGAPLPLHEVILVTLSGYILDLDLLVAEPYLKNRASHHLLPTHTPLFVITSSILGFILLNKYFSGLSLLLSSISMFVHLILDDLGYWLCKLNLQKESKTPQIFWLYPFDNRRKKFIEKRVMIESGRMALSNYLSRAGVSVISEIIITTIALVVLVFS